MNHIETFKALRATRSRNEKIDILKQSDDITQYILAAAYNPFLHYFINKKLVYKPEDMILYTLDSAPGFARILSRLSTRILSGHDAITAATRFMNTLQKDDAELFMQILKKDLRCGISAKTINAAIPGLIPEFGAMLAKKWEESRFNKNLVMSLKYDGLRAIFKGGKFYSRNGHEFQGLQHLEQIIPKEYSFDGELLMPGEHFQDSSGKLRSDDPTPGAVYMVFDIPESTMEFTRRYQLYKDVCEQLDSSFVKPVKHINVRSLGHIDRTFEMSLDKKYEGLVIKTKGHRYQTKRSWDWMKLKAQNDEDLEIVEYYEGEGKYEGMLGGFIVDYKGKEVRVGSGFSDAERHDLWFSKHSQIGNIIEVKYHEVTPDGSLRHPVFGGFRYDK
jgi:DNA ligase 1